MAAYYPNQSSALWELLRLRDAKFSLKPQSMRLRSGPLWDAIHRLFPPPRKAYKQALAAAGIPLDVLEEQLQIEWTPKKVVKKLKQFAAPRIPLNRSNVVRHDPKLVEAVRRYFDSYDDALRAAGFDPDKIRIFRQWTPQQVINAIRKLHDEKGDLSYASLYKHHDKLARRMQNHLGSHKKALEAAGIEPEVIESFSEKVWTKEKVLAALGKLRSENGDLTRFHLLKHNCQLLTAMKSHFGGHKQALRAAGIDPDLYKRRWGPNVAPGHWKPDTLVAKLKEMHSSGEDVRDRKIRENDALMWRSAKKLFGSYQAAIQEAGIDYEEMSRIQRALQRERYKENVRAAANWTPESLLAALKEMDEKGEDLRHEPIKNKHQLMFWAVRELFGSYVNAVREAGIDYWTMNQGKLVAQRGRTAEDVRGEMEGVGEE